MRQVFVRYDAAFIDVHVGVVCDVSLRFRPLRHEAGSVTSHVTFTHTSTRPTSLDASAVNLPTSPQRTQVLIPRVLHRLRICHTMYNVCAN